MFSLTSEVANSRTEGGPAFENHEHHETPDDNFEAGDLHRTVPTMENGNAPTSKVSKTGLSVLVNPERPALE